jgi:hypothetical protein
MKSYWLKWTMENHGFSNIRLTNEEVSQFSGAVKEYLQYEDDVYTLLSLKYFFPAKPKPGEKTKPLGKDQMLQNSLFLRECKAVWRQAKEELREQVLALVTGSLERTSKSRDSHSGPGIRREGHLHQSEVNALQSIGIKRLKQWVEDDEDAMAAQTKSNTSKDQEDAKKAHINFVKHKDGSVKEFCVHSVIKVMCFTSPVALVSHSSCLYIIYIGSVFVSPKVQTALCH